MRVPRVAWLTIVGAFAILDGIALVNEAPDDTFSAQIWALLGVVPVLAVPLVGFLGWLAWHFVEPVLRRLARDRDGEQSRDRDAGDHELGSIERQPRQHADGEETETAQVADTSHHTGESRVGGR